MIHDTKTACVSGHYGIPEIVISDEKSSIWFLAITIHDEVIFILIKYVMEIHGFFECYLI